MNFTKEELDLIAVSGVSVEEVSKIIEMFPQSLDTAIGAVVMLKKGMGQERNEPFSGEVAPGVATE